MYRITRKNVEGAFQLFLNVIGGRVAASYDDVGGYRLDYNSVYGGYNVEQIHNMHGGVSNPFGDTRRSTSEMFYTLHFAVRAIEHTQIVKRQEHVTHCPKKGNGCSHFTTTGEVK